VEPVGGIGIETRTLTSKISKEMILISNYDAFDHIELLEQQVQEQAKHIERQAQLLREVARALEGLYKLNKALDWRLRAIENEPK